MIKHIIFAMLVFVSTPSVATEKITLYWGFSPASNTANTYRALVRELNRTQNKYEFVFETKPGAGGAVAANHVLNNPNNTLLGGTSTFFVRSNFEKNTGYSTDSFKPVFVQSLGSPLALWSNKYKNFSDVKKTDSFTVSISGFGSHSNLMAKILQETYPNLRIINYTSLTDSTRDVVGKHIDFGWNWLTDVDQQVIAGNGNVFAITGSRAVGPYKTFVSQNIKGFEDTSTNTAIYASHVMPDHKLEEIHAMIQSANKSTEIRALYAKEYSVPAEFKLDQTRAWYVRQARFWEEKSTKIK